MTIGAYELPDTEDYYLYAEHSALLRVLDVVLHFGVLVPLAVAGIVLTARDWRRLWFLYGYLVLTILSVAAFVVFARYRFPLAPVLVMFVAGGAVAVFGSENSKRKTQSSNTDGAQTTGRKQSGPARRNVTAMIAAAGAAVAANARVYAGGERGANAVAFSNHADALVNDGRVEDAVLEYRRSLVLGPDDAETHAQLGAALNRINRFEESLFEFDKALAVAPGFAAAHTGAGRALVSLGDFGRAEKELRESLRLGPDNTEAMELLGWALAAGGRPAEAVPVLQRAVDSGKAGVAAFNNLGNAYAMLGRVDEAKGAWARALEREPENLDAMTGMGLLAANTGDWAGAKRWLEKVVARDPTREVAMRALEEANRRLGK
ncbi:MAG TPA: tetratricopeptide repeat protein, partial [Phycisphaerales bacterium]|nr:tetratricopeptide repeat protein [Phycisphaerales bacterium]